jgi:hypothetical protein
MERNQLKILAQLGFVLMMLVSNGAFCQNARKVCRTVEYQNQVTPKPLLVRRIRLDVVDHLPNRADEPLSSVCIGLFDDATRRMILSISPDRNGRVTIRQLKDGDYTLVVTDVSNQYCPANVPIR